jgi:hypothetical protein
MDNHEACQSPLADRFARFRSPPAPFAAARAKADLAEIRGFSRLARLLRGAGQQGSIFQE